MDESAIQRQKKKRKKNKPPHSRRRPSAGLPEDGTDTRRFGGLRHPLNDPVKFFGKEGFGEEEPFVHKRFSSPKRKNNNKNNILTKKYRKEREGARENRFSKRFPSPPRNMPFLLWEENNNKNNFLL